MHHLCHNIHPLGSGLKFIEIKEAFDTLIDKHSRTSYDWALKVYYNSLHSSKRSSHLFGYGSDASDEEYPSNAEAQSTADDTALKNGTDTKVYWWIIWGVIVLIRFASSGSTSNSTSYHVQNQYNGPTINYINLIKPSNSVFLTGNSELHSQPDIRDPRFTNGFHEKENEVPANDEKGK